MERIRSYEPDRRDLPIGVSLEDFLDRRESFINPVNHREERQDEMDHDDTGDPVASGSGGASSSGAAASMTGSTTSGYLSDRRSEEAEDHEVRGEEGVLRALRRGEGFPAKNFHPGGDLQHDRGDVRPKSGRARGGSDAVVDHFRHGIACGGDLGDPETWPS